MDKYFFLSRNAIEFRKKDLSMLFVATENIFDREKKNHGQKENENEWAIFDQKRKMIPKVKYFDRNK